MPPKLLKAAIQNNRMDLAAHAIVLSLVKETINNYTTEENGTSKKKPRRTARQ